MRPKICVPIVADMREKILGRAEEINSLSMVEMVEWRIDFFQGQENEIFEIADELCGIFSDKELIVTLRTEKEGGEANGSRFDYFHLIEEMLRRGNVDYVDVEVSRDEDRLRELKETYIDSGTKIIGSYHDFYSTPSQEVILQKLDSARLAGCDMGKLACMPVTEEDVDLLLMATAKMKERHPDFPLITMSMGELGEKSRLYGGLYGSEVSFGSVGEISAPGQISIEKMNQVYDKIYAEKKHIFLIGFMGVGKSTISKELSRRCNRPELDTDQWIEENEGMSIPEIFERKGEEYFRKKETEMLDELGSLSPTIVSCGGGMALREINVRKMQALGAVVFLTAEPETIYERVKDSTNRPLLAGHMNVEYIHELMKKRRPYYERAATLRISTDRRMLSDIAKEILEKCH